MFAALASTSSPTPGLRSVGLGVDLARDRHEVREAQRLRHAIFSQEMGAQFDSRFQGIDEDRFDAYCDHLVVRDLATGKLVGTTRLLTQEQALLAGGFYTETEFDLHGVLRIPGRVLEVGRTCIHPDHRSGAAIGVLWSGIAPFLEDGGYDVLIGCASIAVPHGDDFGPVHRLARRLERRHLTPAGHRAIPHHPVPEGHGDSTDRATPPPLLKAYLRLGAQIAGAPCWDADFRTADLPIVLQRHRMDPRYVRHFLKMAS